MLHKTGSGKITLDSRYAGPGMIKALLYNFDIDGDTVKPEHIEFLKAKVVPILRFDLGRIWMKGSTSKSGSDKYNKGLSRRRVNNIASVLRSQGIMDYQMQLDAIGEEQAQDHAIEEESDRAVALVVIPVAKKSSSPPKKIPPPPPINNVFKIRLLGGLAAGVGPAQTENIYFQIADTQNMVTSFYSYGGGGAGKGIGKVGVTFRGPWNTFRTSSPIRVSQFEGAARFTSAGGLWWSRNYLNMMGLPVGVSTIPRALSIKTGCTIGAGVSTTIGKMIWVPREEMIYKGD